MDAYSFGSVQIFLLFYFYGFTIVFEDEPLASPHFYPPNNVTIHSTQANSSQVLVAWDSVWCLFHSKVSVTQNGQQMSCANGDCQEMPLAYLSWLVRWNQQFWSRVQSLMSTCHSLVMLNCGTVVPTNTCKDKQPTIFNIWESQ